MHSAYVIRMASGPGGRYWTHVVGNVPAPTDAVFVDHRADFMTALVEYNELKEARVLRKTILDYQMSGDHKPGELEKYDPAPEAAALNTCLTKLHKKLKL